MSLAYKRFKVYLRVGLVAVIIVLAAVVLFMNRKHTVRLWFFGLTDPEKPTNVVWVMLWTVFLTRTVWWLFSFGRGMIRDLREIKNQRVIDEVERTQRERTTRLEEQERRIDEKLKRVAEPEASDGEESST